MRGKDLAPLFGMRGFQFWVAVFGCLEIAAPSFADQTPLDLQRRAEASKVFDCARSILEHKLGGSDGSAAVGVQAAAYYLNAIHDDADSPVKNMSALKQDCARMAAQLKPTKTPGADMLRMAQNLVSLPSSVVNTMTSLIRPYVTCKRGGLSLVGAPLWWGTGYGVGASVVGGRYTLMGSRCAGTNGRKWFEISSGRGLSEGWGIMLDASGGTSHAFLFFDDPGTLISSEESADLHKSIAAFVGESSDQFEKTTAPPQVETGLGSNHVRGLALGMGVSQSWGNRTDYKFIEPTADNSSFLDDLLETYPWGKPISREEAAKAAASGPGTSAYANYSDQLPFARDNVKLYVPASPLDSAPPVFNPAFGNPIQ